LNMAVRGGVCVKRRGKNGNKGEFVVSQKDTLIHKKEANHEERRAYGLLLLASQRTTPESRRSQSGKGGRGVAQNQKQPPKDETNTRRGRPLRKGN